MRLAEALARSLPLRRPLYKLSTAERADSYRLLDGREEGADAWTVDRYGDAVLVQSFHPQGADEAELGAAVEVLQAEMPGLAVVLKERSAALRADPQRARGRLLNGPLPPPHPGDPLGYREGRIGVWEAGLRYGVDLLHGSLTGLFTDARPLRSWLRERAVDRRVLNLFSYTAAFGVAAAAGGARSTTNVDIVETALERGRINYALNDLRADTRTHLRSDALIFVRKALQRAEQWDLIVLDPPPFSTPRGKGRRRTYDARRDFDGLVTSCRQLLAPGGQLLVLSARRGESPAVLDGAFEQLQRGPDHPGAPEQGLRAWVLEPERDPHP